MCVCVCVCVCMCVCSNIFSETTGPIEAKFHTEPPSNRGRKFIQMVRWGPGHLLFFIIVNLLRGGGGGRGAFSRDFTVNLSPQCRAFSRALKTEKLKAPLFLGPRRDWNYK